MRFTPKLADAELLTLHRETLFRHHVNGRLQAINEPGFPEPPQFWMGRTREGNQWRFHDELPQATVAALDELCRTEPNPRDLQQPLQNEAALKAVLSAHTPIRTEYRGPVYLVPQGANAPGEVTMITTVNAELLRPHFADLLEPAPYYQLGPVATVIADGCAVSVCFCSRIPGQATEAGLHTHPDYRGRGYAAAAVAGWAAAVRVQGCLPLYSTSWDNLASQGVARRLGMEMYGEDWSLK